MLEGFLGHSECY